MLLGDGTLDGRYRIHRKLGSGGMGIVYEAEHIALGKRVAVKVLRSELSHDPGISRRFELEARAASRIGHEGIVDVTDFGRTPGGALYFVMELLAGPSLAETLAREGRLSPRRALEVLLPLAEALEAAHEHGIIHRDLKPQNVMQVPRRDGTFAVKLLDFGVSKVSREGAERLTELGMILGTAEYMSPEQAGGEGVDARTDIYAFGVLAYELCTGVKPFTGRETMAVLLKHLTEVPPSPRLHAPEIPPRLEALILRALKKAPGERPQTMGEVLAELRALAQEWTDGTEATAPPVRESLPPSTPAPVLLEDTFISESKRVPEPSPAPVQALAPPRAVTPVPTVPDVAGEDTEEPSPEVLAVLQSRRRPFFVAGAVLGLLVILAGGLTWLRASPREGATPPSPVALPPESKPTAPKPLRASTTVRSVPSGATVFRGEQRLGLTPLTVEDDGGELRLSLDGYRPERVVLTPGKPEVEIALSKKPPSPLPSKTLSPPRYDKVEDLKASPY